MKWAVTVLVVLALAWPRSVFAQSVTEKDGRVEYASPRGKRTDLGIGFSPVLTERGRVALIRGHQFDYGEPFDCHNSATKNWIALVNPATGAETTLFDHPLSFGREGLEFCIFHQMQLSPDDSTLYLVSIVYATSGALAIIRLRDGAVNYIPGVDDVYVITSGTHRGELIYQQRRKHQVSPLRAEDWSPYYPFVHARADGTLISAIAEENLDGARGKGTKLAEYLRGIRGTIIVNGQAFPK